MQCLSRFLALFLSASVSLSTQKLAFGGKISDSKVLTQSVLESGHNLVKGYSSFHHILGFYYYRYKRQFK